MTIEERMEKIEKWIENQPMPHKFTPDTIGVKYCHFCGEQDGQEESDECPKRSLNA